jgi:RNA polymerase sigma-70 factor (ECF subfamily)
MTRTADFDQLMADVANGSEEAVWELAETYTPYIIRAVRRSLSSQIRPKLDSQDFAQTLWASLLLRRDDLTRLTTPEELIAYLAAAAKNKVIDQARRLKSSRYNVALEESLGDQRWEGDLTRRPLANRLYAPDPTPSRTAGIRERWNQILQAASQRDRHILQMRLEGSSFEAISAKLQINEITARRAMCRLVAQLSE